MEEFNTPLSSPRWYIRLSVNL